MASLEDLMNAIASGGGSFSRAALEPGWAMAPPDRFNEYVREIPTVRPPEEIGGFDRFLMGSGAQYLSPEERSDARWYGVLSALGSIPQRGLLGAIPAGMEAGRSAVDYEQAQRMGRDWQGYTGDEATRAVEAGDQIGYERWASAFYGKPGVLPKAQYPPQTIQQETVGFTPTGEPINQPYIVTYEPSVGRYVAKNIPGARERTMGSRDLRLMSPAEETRLLVRNSEIEAARRELRRRKKKGLLAPENFDSTEDMAKLFDDARKRKSDESEDTYFGFVDEFRKILPGQTNVTEQGPLGSGTQGPPPPSTRARPRTAQDKVGDLRKRYGLE